MYENRFFKRDACNKITQKRLPTALVITKKNQKNANEEIN
jgi:hypothetical protein